MYNSYQISSRVTGAPSWQLFTGDLVIIKDSFEKEYFWLYSISRRVGEMAVVLGPIKSPGPGDEDTYIIQFLSDCHMDLVDWEEVELVSQGHYEGI